MTKAEAVMEKVAVSPRFRKATTGLIAATMLGANVAAVDYAAKALKHPEVIKPSIEHVVKKPLRDATQKLLEYFKSK